VSFFSIDDKIWALSLRDKLKKSAMGISSDLTKNQRSTLQGLRAKGQYGYYKNGKLFIKDTQPGNTRPGNNQTVYQDPSADSTNGPTIGVADRGTPNPQRRKVHIQRDQQDGQGQ